MRIVIQRVSHASVKAEPNYFCRIGEGMMILVGVENGDTDDDVEFLAKKTAALRIFNDENGVMNCSIVDIDGQIMAISQFTLLASTRKGNRPSYVRSAPGEFAHDLYLKFCRALSEKVNRPIALGVFGADMKIELLNDGPVTIIIDSRIRE